ncbi:alpha/beta hydrolase [Micromonospora sp. NPDC048909]|uniref:alpha/beta fold hydrolase n=1 Tax=Micromonospora sp. NPDC048909 TaxID=3155643 RepID=UPI0033DBA630
MSTSTRYRTVTVDGLSIFYREAGPPDAPTLLLLHGFPSSSRMFEPLLGRLADRFRLIAPDYPGFGHSEAPDPGRFRYTFDRIAEVMSRFAATVGAERYLLYVQDYGGPVGFRMALAEPDRLTGLVVQNAVAHEVGLGPLWESRRAFWRDRAGHEAAVRENFLSLDAARTRHVGSDPDPQRYDPDLWTDEHAFLSRPGQAEIQLDLFYDYRTNVASYRLWQEWLRRTGPRLLVLWGRYDTSFEPGEAEAYRADVPGAEVYLLDGGHFLMDTRADEVASLVRGFASSGG